MSNLRGKGNKHNLRQSLSKKYARTAYLLQISHKVTCNALRKVGRNAEHSGGFALGEKKKQNRPDNKP